MDDDDFAKLLEDHLESTTEANRDLGDVEIVWIRDSEEYGSLHMLLKHDVREHEVAEVIFEIPPVVEAKRGSKPGRTNFFGATTCDRLLFVACEDWTEGGQRYLKPITAFDCTEEYWRTQ